MEQIDIITVAFFLLAMLVLAFGIWAFVAFTKPVEEDIPVTYDETDFSEWPFVDNYNY
jgi:hypothetical protein